MTIRENAFERLAKYIEDTSDSIILDDSNGGVNEKMITLSDKCQLGYDGIEEEINLYSMKHGTLKRILAIEKDSSFIRLLEDIIQVVADEDISKDIRGMILLSEFEECRQKYERDFIQELSERNDMNIHQVEQNFKEIIKNEYESFISGHESSFDLYVIANYIDHLVAEAITEVKRENKKVGC